MKSLLICAALAATACSDVRVVDDDGPGRGGDDGAGGAGSGLGGGAPGNEPLTARLFAAGWLGSEEAEGLLIWNNPDEQGIDRAPDVTIPLSNIADVAVAGDNLLVFKPPQLFLYENAWELRADAVPKASVEVYGYASDTGHRMRFIPELDLLAIDSLVIQNVSSLNANTIPLEAPWANPVYDAPSDRLFVTAGAGVAVLETASTRTAYEPDWQLFISDNLARGLTSDGSKLYTAAFQSATQTSESWTVFVWPIDVTAPASAVEEYEGIEQLYDLAAIPSGGFVAASQGEVAAWAGPANATGAYQEEGVSWRSVVVSQNGHVYASGGFGTSAFATVELLAPEEAVGGGSLALIER